MTNVVMKAVKDLDVKMVSQEYGSFSTEKTDRAFECKAIVRAKLSVADEFESHINAVSSTQANKELITI